jgi:ABC-type uncharacterized transport system substrate-binding protein
VVAVPYTGAATSGRCQCVSGMKYWAPLILQTHPLVVSQHPIVRWNDASGVMPAYGLREFVDAGGLMSYGPSLVELRRQAAIYVDKILKGPSPATCPSSNLVEPVINGKTVTALGLPILQSLLARADGVIQ